MTHISRDARSDVCVAESPGRCSGAPSGGPGRRKRGRRAPGDSDQDWGQTRHLNLTVCPWPSAAALLLCLHRRRPRGRRVAQDVSQPLKWEQVGGCRPPLPLGLLGALQLLFLLGLSVLGPGGSQDPRHLCLRAGPLLLVRRESASRVYLGSYSLALQGEGWGRPRVSSEGREHRWGRRAPVAAYPEPVVLGIQGPTGAGEEPSSDWDSSTRVLENMLWACCWGHKDVYTEHLAEWTTAPRPLSATSLGKRCINVSNCRGPLSVPSAPRRHLRGMGGLGSWAGRAGRQKVTAHRWTVST